MNAGQRLRNPDADHVLTPSWFYALYEGWFDPYSYGSKCLKAPLSNTAKIFMNPGYSRADEAVNQAIKWHQSGHTVHMLIPIESSTQRAKKLIQYGCRRLYFEKRIYKNVRGVELVILTG